MFEEETENSWTSQLSLLQYQVHSLEVNKASDNYNYCSWFWLEYGVEDHFLLIQILFLKLL